MANHWLQYRPNTEAFDPAQFEWRKDDGAAYFQVAGRVLVAHFDAERFAKDNGADEILSITTDIVRWDEQRIVMKAVVTTYKGTFTGYASVRWDSNNEIERDFPIEVCETSAVGRALAFAGYGIQHGIASAEEMFRVSSTSSSINQELLQKAKQDLAQRATTIPVNPTSSPSSSTSSVSSASSQQTTPTSSTSANQNINASNTSNFSSQRRPLQRRRRSLMMQQQQNNNGYNHTQTDNTTSASTQNQDQYPTPAFTPPPDSQFAVYDKQGQILFLSPKIRPKEEYYNAKDWQGRDIASYPEEPATIQQQQLLQSIVKSLTHRPEQVDVDRLMKELLQQVGAPDIQSLTQSQIVRVLIKVAEITSKLARIRSGLEQP